MTILVGIALWLTVGAVAVASANILTGGRLQRNFDEGTGEIQDAVMKSTLAPVTLKTSGMVLFLAIWVLWPVTVYGAIEGAVKRRRDSNNKEATRN